MISRPLSCRRGARHECPSCGRLLGLQSGHALHVKYKDFEGVVEGRIRLQCRCRCVVVVVTTEADGSG